MGLINKVDMVCLSPVGYGVIISISHRRQTYHINLVDQTHTLTSYYRASVFMQAISQVKTWHGNYCFK